MAADTIAAAVRSVRVFSKLFAASVRAHRQYKVDFALAVVNGVLFQGTLILFVVVVLNRFGSIGGWSAADVMLIIGLRCCGHALCVLVFGNVETVPASIRDGSFDRFFLTPLPVLTQVLLSRFNINAFGDVALGVVTLTIALTKVASGWTAGHWLFLLTTLAGAALLEAGLQIAVAGFGMRSGGMEAVSMSVDTSLAALTPYPVTILPAGVQPLFYTVVPIAYLAYLPAAALLARPDPILPATVAWFSPLAGVLVFLAGLAIWRSELKRYEPFGA